MNNLGAKKIQITFYMVIISTIQLLAHEDYVPFENSLPSERALQDIRSGAEPMATTRDWWDEGPPESGGGGGDFMGAPINPSIFPIAFVATIYLLLRARRVRKSEAE